MPQFHLTLKTSLLLLLLLWLLQMLLLGVAAAVVSSDFIMPAINKFVQYCIVRAFKSFSLSVAVSDEGIDCENQFRSI